MAIAVITTFALAILTTLAWATTQPSAAESAGPASAADRAVPVSGARSCPPGSKPAGSGCIDKHPVLICKPAQRAVKFYAGRIAYWRSKMGAGIDRKHRHLARTCPRYLSHVLQRKAYALRKAYPIWRKRVWEHEYAWWLWLPDKFRRVGHCETGGTAGATAAGNWHWDSGTYVSAFGIIRAAFPTWNGHNTPREQYEVAAAIQRRFGWSAWGCGGA